MADSAQTTIVSDQGRVGLARSRHEVEGSEGANKKQKTKGKGWVHDQVQQQEEGGGLICCCSSTSTARHC